MAISCYCHHPCCTSEEKFNRGWGVPRGDRGPQIGWWTRLTGRKEGRNHFQGYRPPASVKRRWNGVKPSGKRPDLVRICFSIITCFPGFCLPDLVFLTWTLWLMLKGVGENYMWVYLRSVQLPSCLWCEFDIARNNKWGSGVSAVSVTGPPGYDWSCVILTVAYCRGPGLWFCPSVIQCCWSKRGNWFLKLIS